MKIKITVNGTEMEVEPAEARRLYNELHSLFGTYNWNYPYYPTYWGSGYIWNNGQYEGQTYAGGPYYVVSGPNTARGEGAIAK